MGFNAARFRTEVQGFAIYVSYLLQAKAEGHFYISRRAFFYLSLLLSALFYNGDNSVCNRLHTILTIANTRPAFGCTFYLCIALGTVLPCSCIGSNRSPKISIVEGIYVCVPIYLMGLFVGVYYFVAPNRTQQSKVPQFRNFAK